jgi:MoxR-like ATPase
MFKLNVPFPRTDELVAILEHTTGTENRKAGKVADGELLLAMSRFARAIPASSQVTRAAAALVAATHPDGDGAGDMVRRFVRNGASPRGAQSLLLGARVLALLKGRLNVALEDLRDLAPAALRHRILMNFEGQAEGVRPDDVVREVVARL